MSTNLVDLKKAAGGGVQQALIAQQTTAMQIAPETASSAVAAKVKATVQARYEMAVYRPRDLDVVRQRMLKECQRPSFAEVAKYSRPQGKKQVDGRWVDNVIEGPGIRFAEMAIRCMTNLVVETMTVYDDREKRIVNVSVTDLEGNVPYAQDITIQKSIERSKTKEGDVVLRERLNSYGNKVYLLEANDDDIMNKQNALISKAIRTLGLRLVPGDIIDECMDAVSATQRNKDAQDPDAAKHRLYDAFAKQGVTVENLKEYLGHNGDTLNPKELEQLRGVHAAIKDGETTWRDVMEGRRDNDKPKDKPPAATPATDAKPAAEPKKETVKTEVKKEPEEAPTDAAEVGSAEPSDLYTYYGDLINEATSLADLEDTIALMQKENWKAPTDLKMLQKKADTKKKSFAPAATLNKPARQPIE